MAIVKELYKIDADGTKFYKTYSDKSYMIRKIGTDEMYEEAIDLENTNYEYEETTEPIESLSEVELKAQAYDILVGEVE